MMSKHLSKQLILVVFGFILMLVPACRKQQEQIEYYPTGQIKYVYKLEEEPYGNALYTYYPNGKLESKSFWQSGKQNGKAIFYYPSSGIKSTSFWKMGLPSTESKSYYENGKVKENLFWGNNGAIQVLHDFYQNGKRKRIVAFSKLHEYKTVFLFDSLGNPLEKQVKDSKESLLYSGSFERNGQELLGTIVPLYFNETGTTPITGTYKTDMCFGLKINKETRLVLSSNKTFKKADTLSAILSNRGVMFHITINPKIGGINKFYYKFICPNCKTDTLATVGTVSSHSFIVKK